MGVFRFLVCVNLYLLRSNIFVARRLPCGQLLPCVVCVLVFSCNLLCVGVGVCVF